MADDKKTRTLREISREAFDQFDKEAARDASVDLEAKTATVVLTYLEIDFAIEAIEVLEGQSLEVRERVLHPLIAKLEKVRAALER